MTEKSKSEHFQWAETQHGWKDKNGKIIPFAELTDAQLHKYYKLAQHKELMYLNKSYVFADKRSEMKAEAKRRGIALKSINSDFHSKELNVHVDK